MKTNFNTTLLLLVCFLSGLSQACAQSKTQEVQDLMKLYGEYGKFQGSVLVAEGNEVIYKGGIGYANVEWEIPNASDTKHRLGSITKQFTAMLIMQLAEAGKLDLQKPITTYIPDYPKKTGDLITTHHLLTHTAGIPNYTSFPGFFADKSRNPYSPKEFLSEFQDMDLEFKPGETFAYSNSGYFLLGVIVENLTGMSYAEALDKMIFEPLGMEDTGYDVHGEIIKNRASGYEKQGHNLSNAPYLDMSIPYAAGSMYSTVEDLHKWDRALYTEKLVSQKYLDMSFTKYIESFGGHYGYGWSLEKYRVGTSKKEVDIIGHGGGINGFNTLITRVPSEDLLVVLFSNAGGAPLSDMTRAVLGIVEGEPYNLPEKSVAIEMESLIRTQGLDAAKQAFLGLADKEGYDLNENEMNGLGYRFLREEKLEEAAYIMKQNTEHFPKSFNVYDSYAEVLAAQGKKEEAVKNYRKSVEMNPGNQNGIDMLEKLGVDVSEFNKEVVVADEILQEYVGKYELMPGFVIDIQKEGSQLKAQATGQPAFDIFPKDDNVFYLKAITAQLTFNRDDAGKVKSVTLLQGGREMEGPRKE